MRAYLSMKKNILRRLTLFCFLLLSKSLSYGQWTDPTLVANITPIRSVHIAELRSKINAKQTACGLPTQVWTDPILTPKNTKIKKIHLDELRLATTNLVNTFRAQQGLFPMPPTYTDSVLTSFSTPVKAIHISELRSYVDGVTCATTCPPLTLSWSIGANTCSGSTPSTTVGATTAVSDTTMPLTGNAHFMCNAGGVWASAPTPNPGPPATPTCSACTLGNGTTLKEAGYGQCWITFSPNPMGNDCRESWPDCNKWIAEPQQPCGGNPNPTCTTANPLNDPCHPSQQYCKSPAAFPAGSCNMYLCQ